MGGSTCGGCGAREGGRRGLGARARRPPAAGGASPAVSGGSPGNYLLSANFGKDGRRRHGAAGVGSPAWRSTRARSLWERLGGLSEGLHDITSSPGTCRPPHLGADPLAGPRAGSSRQGRGRSWPRSGDPGCLPPGVALEGKPLAARLGLRRVGARPPGRPLADNECGGLNSGDWVAH